MRRALFLTACIAAGLASPAQGNPAPTAPPKPSATTFSGLHVEQLLPPSTRPVVVKRAACQAAGRPDAVGVLTLEDTGGLSYRIARLEYNDHGGEMLARIGEVDHLRGYYQRYVRDHQPVNKLLVSALITTWRWFGLKFNWDKVDYFCRLEELPPRVPSP